MRFKDFFAGKPHDWKLPAEGVLFLVQTPLVPRNKELGLITDAAAMNSWGEMRESLGVIDWRIRVLQSDGVYIELRLGQVCPATCWWYYEKAVIL